MYDGSAYCVSQNVWLNSAVAWEINDLDICGGHSAGTGDYHHHSFSPCLKEVLNDVGTGHSPIYGWIVDGYPIYGPYQASGVLAKSCWKKRDYSSSSATGCSSGTRTCLLVDQYDITKGTKTASCQGPSLTTTLTSQSGNSVSSASGIFFEDYYYDATCFAQGGEYLNANNGHDHDNLGWHYHFTVDSSFSPVFPYIIGPKYYGCVSTRDCATGSSTCGTSVGVGVPNAKCGVY